MPVNLYWCEMDCIVSLISQGCQYILPSIKRTHTSREHRANAEFFALNIFDSVIRFQFKDRFHIYVNFFSSLSTILFGVLYLDEKAASLRKLKMEFKISLIGLVSFEFNFLQ